jgi:hypothetical protein
VLLVLGFVLAVGACLTGPAGAADLSSRLAAAEREVAAAEGEVPAREAATDAARERNRATARRAVPLQLEAREAESAAEALAADLAARESRAQGRIAQLEAQHRKEVDDHDREVRNGIGFGLAALVAAGIALGWGRFRASPPVAALTGMDQGRAIGLCAGGGLLAVIVGLVLGGSDGALGALGSFLFCLGLILPIALILGRHSTRVQRGDERALLGRERLPGWVPIAAGSLLALVFLASAGSAVLADDVASKPVTPELSAEAAAATTGAGAEELAAAEARAEAARARAAGPAAKHQAARSSLTAARRSLASAERQLARAESSRRSLSRRLDARQAKEEREAERARERQEEEAAELAIQEEEDEEEAFASECHPSYSGCLDPSSPDYDCLGGSGDGPDYTGTVSVYGYDEYGLDDDGDGIGCESS